MGTGSPALDVVGSYVPAWMMCTVLGVLGAIGLRLVLVAFDLETRLVAPLVVHALVALTVTLCVWLAWFGH